MASLRERAKQLVGAHRFFKLINVYPPYVGAGIRVTHITPDLGQLEVEMSFRPWNQNYVGTQFGGSLYAMCDPFFMLLLMERLGPDFIVWDKAASIRFLKPGRGRVRARFLMPTERVEEIRHQALHSQKVEPTFTCDITDDSGTVIAQVEKLLYVRVKPRPPRA